MAQMFSFIELVLKLSNQINIKSNFAHYLYFYVAKNVSC